MKKISARGFGRLVAALFLISAMAGSVFGAEKEFEGRVRMRVEAAPGTQVITCFVKGDKMRMEMEDPRAQGGLMIMDLGKKQLLMLMPSQQMYLTMALPEPEGEVEPGEVVPTGKSREILGYRAKEYRVKQEGEEVAIWATDELGSFGALQLPGQGRPGSPPALSGLLKDQKFFPLLIIQKDGQGKETRVEMTEVEEKKLEDSLFEAPAGYQGMSFPGGGR